MFASFEPKNNSKSAINMRYAQQKPLTAKKRRLDDTDPYVALATDNDFERVKLSESHMDDVVLVGCKKHRSMKKISVNKQFDDYLHNQHPI